MTPMHLTLLAAFLTVTASTAVAQGILHDLGTLPGGTSATANATNADGTVVVGESNGQAFRWTVATGMQPIDVGPGTGFAQDVSADGNTVVGTVVTGGTGHAYRWTVAGGVQDLGLLPGWTWANAHGVSADGQVVVGELANTWGDFTAFRWTAATGMQELGTPPGGGGNSNALAASDDGSVIAGYVWVGRNSSYVWTVSTGMVLLSPAPIGNMNPFAFDLSGDGSTVVGMASPTFGGNPRAASWDVASNTMTLLPTSAVSRARGTNGDGSVIVGTDYTASVSGAFFVSPAAGLLALATLDARAADTNGVSADGRVAVGRLGSPAGSGAFRYEFDSIGVPYCDAVPNSTGATGHINATGSRSAASNDVLLSVEQLPANAFGFFLTSMTTGDVFPVAGSMGRLCLGGALGRYIGPGQAKNSGATGSFQLQLDLTSMPTPTSLVTAAPGDTWSFQAWHRDAVAGVATSNFTDAITITFE